MKNWKIEDIIVLILASTICYGFILYFTKGLFEVVNSTEEHDQIIARLIDSIIAIISVYIGAKIQKNIDK